MKTLALVATLLLAGVAFAEGQLEVRVNRIDMAVTAPDETEDTAGTKAQDYNSSRSNRQGAMDKDDDGNGAKTQTGGITAEDDWATPTTRTPPNHSTTRQSSSATAPGVRAQDRNSTRSNRQGAMDKGDDGSGAKTRTGGITAEDDWETPATRTPPNHDDTTRRSSSATALRESAQDHNTTRSNR